MAKPKLPKVFSLVVTNPRGKVLGHLGVELRGFDLPRDLEAALTALMGRLQGEAHGLATAYMAQSLKRSRRATAAQARSRRRAAG